MAVAQMGLTALVLLLLVYLAAVVRSLRKTQQGTRAEVRRLRRRQADTRDEVRALRTSIAFTHASLQALHRLVRLGAADEPDSVERPGRASQS